MNYDCILARPCHVPFFGLYICVSCYNFKEKFYITHQLCVKNMGGYSQWEKKMGLVTAVKTC